MSGRRIIIAAALLACWIGSNGCQSPMSTTQPSADGLHGDEILRSCAARYSEARTMLLSGMLQDRRNNISQARRVFLAVQRPDRARIEVDDNVAVVVGRGVWTYRGNEEKFGQYLVHSSLPVLTAVDATCDGIRLLSLDVFLRAELALRRPSGTASELRLIGHDFSGRRPCYQFVRMRPGDKEQLRVWIDQDDYTIRRWRLEPAGADPEVRPDACSIDMRIEDLWFNRPLRAGVFQISRPTAQPVRR